MTPNGTVAAFLGLMGSGKTMGMLRFALLQHRPIYINVPLNVPHTYISDFSQLLDLHGAAICLDELQLIVNAREFMKATALDFSEWLELRVRKRGSIFCYTTQDFDLVDINVRRVTSHILYHTAVVASGQPASKVVILKRTLGGVYVVSRRFIMFHEPFYALYNSFHEEVHISFGDTKATGDTHRAARSVSAGGARANIVSGPRRIS